MTRQYDAGAGAGAWSPGSHPAHPGSHLGAHPARHRASPAAAPSAASGYPPLSAKDLARSAEMFEWRPQIPLKFHVGSLDAMYREGKTYLAEHNYAKAYVLLLRFSIICVEKVPTHPEAHTPEGRRLVRTATRRLATVMALLESIKEQLDAARQQWAARQRARDGGGGDDAGDGDAGPPAFAAMDPALSWNPHAQAQLLDAADHVALAVALANGRPQQRGSDTRRDPDDVSRAMERARWQLDAMAQAPGADGRAGGDDVVPVAYHYPSVHRSTPVAYATQPGPSPPGPSSPARPSRPPLPPKQPTETLAQTPAQTPAPPVPLREPLAGLPGRRDAPPLPPKDAGTPTSQYTFKPAAYLENGAPIRSVFLPDTLRSAFLRVAQPNTARGIETCGILCGRTANNALFVTCLLIPQQVGTRDSCETTGEVATLEYCSAHDLLQIGWIHTHPTQTCFMSSLDMHTHAGYQVMMDESIAIVCAPAHEPSWGVFRLTNPPGLPYIGACRRAGAFHEHDLRPHEIYTEAKSPRGHVFVVSGIDYDVADLREA